MVYQNLRTSCHNTDNAHILCAFMVGNEALREIDRQRKSDAFRQVSDALAPHHRLLIAALVAIAPALALMTWQPEYSRTTLRDMSGPVLFLELAIVVALLLRGEGFASRLAKVKPTGLLLTATWFAALSVSAFSAETYPRGALVHHAITLLHVCFFFLLWTELLQAPHLRRRILTALAWSFGIFTVVAYILALSVADHPGFPWSTFGAGVTNIRHLGYYAVLLTGLSAGLLATEEAERKRPGIVVLLFLGILLSLWSGGRGAFGAIVCVLMLVIIMAPAGRRQGLLATFALCFVVALPASALFVPGTGWGPRWIFLRPPPTGGLDPLYNGRDELWQQTLQAIPHRLWFGHGEGQFIHSIEAAKSAFNHPHNFLLQLLFQWGAIGTSLLFFLIAPTLFKTLLAIRTKQHELLPAFVTLAGIGALSLIDGPFFYPLPVLTALTCLSICLAVAKESTSPSSAPTNMLRPIRAKENAA